jgi:hypothetical protein
VNALPTVNTAKAGAAVPVKFSLGGDRGPFIFVSGYPKSQPQSCDASAPTDGIETVTTAGSGLTYDAVSDTYTFVWKTDSSWSRGPAGPCRQLVLRFTDGSTYRANFKFR